MNRTKKFFTIILGAGIGIGLAIFFTLQSDINAQSSIVKGFAARLCKAWNSSSLPHKLGADSQGGSDWINVNTGVTSLPKGIQIIASGRYECSKRPEYFIKIKKSANGKAICVGSGIYRGKRSWQFLPTTANYKTYARSFGMGAFKNLWSNGMKGPYWTAFKNRGPFRIFFKQAYKVGGEYLKPGCKK